MSFSKADIQLTILATIAALMTVFSFTYIFWKQPEALRVTRDGVPFFTPDVINPDDGTAISVDELIQHFKKDGS